MKNSISIIALSAVAIIGTGVALGGSALANTADKAEQPSRVERAPASPDQFWSHAEFERDDDDNLRYGNLPRPSRAALSRVGVSRVLEVEWDDGRIEVEGLDAQGREIDVIMDSTGQRVIRHKVERWDD